MIGLEQTLLQISSDQRRNTMAQIQALKDSDMLSNVFKAHSLTMVVGGQGGQ